MKTGRPSHATVPSHKLPPGRHNAPRRCRCGVSRPPWRAAELPLPNRLPSAGYQPQDARKTPKRAQSDTKTAPKRPKPAIGLPQAAGSRRAAVLVVPLPSLLPTSATRGAAGA